MMRIVIATLHTIISAYFNSQNAYSTYISEMKVLLKGSIIRKLLVQLNHDIHLIILKYQVRYNTYGELNEAKDNLLVVCHALTGNSRLDQWWGSMLGELSDPLSTN